MKTVMVGLEIVFEDEVARMPLHGNETRHDAGTIRV